MSIVVGGNALRQPIRMWHAGNGIDDSLHGSGNCDNLGDAIRKALPVVSVEDEKSTK